MGFTVLAGGGAGCASLGRSGSSRVIGKRIVKVEAFSSRLSARTVPSWRPPPGAQTIARPRPGNRQSGG